MKSFRNWQENSRIQTSYDDMKKITNDIDINKLKFSDYIEKTRLKPLLDNLKEKFGATYVDFMYDDEDDTLHVHFPIGESGIIDHKDRVQKISTQYIQPIVNKHLGMSAIGLAHGPQGYISDIHKPFVPYIMDAETGDYYVVIDIPKPETIPTQELEKKVENFILAARKVKIDYEKLLQKAHQQANPGYIEPKFGIDDIMKIRPGQTPSEYQQALIKAKTLASQKRTSAFVVNQMGKFQVTDKRPHQFQSYDEFTPDGKHVENKW